MTPDTLRRHLKSVEEQRLFAQDACMLAITEAIQERLRTAEISHVELAARIGRSKGFVSQVLNGSRNMTLRTLADLLWALGLEVRGLRLVRLGERSVVRSMRKVSSTLSPKVPPRTARTRPGVRTTGKPLGRASLR